MIVQPQKKQRVFQSRCDIYCHLLFYWFDTSILFALLIVIANSSPCKWLIVGFVSFRNHDTSLQTLKVNLLKIR